MKPINHFYLFPKLECGELFVCAIHTPSRGDVKHKDDYAIFTDDGISHFHRRKCLK
jgi:hypothetical protein